MKQLDIIVNTVPVILEKLDMPYNTGLKNIKIILKTRK